MSDASQSLSLVDNTGSSGGKGHWIGNAVMALGCVFFVMSIVDKPIATGWTGLLLTYGVFIVGAVVHIFASYWGTTQGIKHHGLMFHTMSGRKVGAYLLGLTLTGLYCCLYWKPEFLGFVEWGAPANGPIAMLDPLSEWLRTPTGIDKVTNLPFDPVKSDQWFMYGFIYTVAVSVMGLRMFFKYRHNRYHILRTASVVFFQLGFGFLIPHLLRQAQQPEYYFTYFWPLKYEYLFPGNIETLRTSSEALGTFMVFWGIAASFVITPILTYLYGKRWYCSWVCGCGGMAETAGDPFRQMSSKKESAWRFERYSIHIVLVLIVVVTGMMWLDSALHGELLGEWSKNLKNWYGFVVGAALSGVVGVGFYPLLGSRVWCRFFCPMAAVLGIIQRFFSRFRITTNGDQCMSCGNCSTYCEMGIDVRAYAMAGKDIIRASCVGCGVCAAVCPRGVLKLENGSHSGRFDDKLLSSYLKELSK